MYTLIQQQLSELWYSSSNPNSTARTLIFLPMLN